MIIFVIVAMLIALIAVVFAVQNTAVATISFLVWTFQGSLALVLLVALFAGVLICLFALLPAVIRNRWTIRRQTKQIKTLELSLSDLEQSLAEEKQAARAAQAKVMEVQPPPAAA